ncbi:MULTISPECIES: ABC transporter ATP-binding protein [Paracoccus]|jgi:iron complex transport system ATP-binding protein|uniref:ABC transporter related protein n=1 Tax=Paracoccus denitrificans (strain Pd 1222) TaxID=318586 RepID=A1B156_PARDP|nr:MULTISPECIES: ABC transporter ATP-binding protein [Paracoccus]ABL69250.1 ABC transporter related protein [Paracoccus denitrificans PD1222]MBB4629096.1 iron complex transport system ATP-binding protein [Paracoccus denitrificans]MCU7430745.1 ABC transporter ATP-binding protein [Paracoccus denitrificans]MDK8874598.1 ABC transporter ATP-binding protein [Paracoccus sp. SSJ]QAR27257.1 ABC transporter ATP-binding protein [Paracoccus denitrificans]
MTLFTLSGVSYDVPGRRLIEGLDLEIRPGMVTALIGRNGSGKSTLLKLISGQNRPSTGRIAYAGRDLATWSPRELARDLAYLPQVTPPAEGMLVEELVALGRFPWRGALGRFRPEDHAAVDAAIARCHVGHLRDRLVDTLSGGERQRSWIAMMLAQGARTLLLDEPISALDVAHQVEVLDLVHGMCRNEGLSAIVVLHDLNMAARYCDHVVALGSGRLLLDGPIGALMTPEALLNIYGLRMHVAAHEGHAFALPR